MREILEQLLFVSGTAILPGLMAFYIVTWLAGWQNGLLSQAAVTTVTVMFGVPIASDMALARQLRRDRARRDIPAE